MDINFTFNLSQIKTAVSTAALTKVKQFLITKFHFSESGACSFVARRFKSQFADCINFRLDFCLFCLLTTSRIVHLVQIHFLFFVQGAKSIGKIAKLHPKPCAFCLLQLTFKYDIIIMSGDDSMKYEFEWTDIRALITVANVIGVLTIGLIASWIGLAVAVYDLIQDFRHKNHINVFVIHFALLILNGYFLLMLYNLI